MDIIGFYGENRYLSNTYKCDVELDGDNYPSVENAYHAAKVDQKNRLVFISCSPFEAKRLGRSTPSPRNWDKVKLDVMKELVYKKFRYNKDLALKLLSTAPWNIVEDNTWGDTFWGTCKGVGKNHLGEILMQVRAELTERNNISLRKRQELKLDQIFNETIEIVNPSVQSLSTKIEMIKTGTGKKNYAVSFQEFNTKFKIYCFDEVSAQALERSIRTNAVHISVKTVKSS